MQKVSWEQVRNIRSDLNFCHPKGGRGSSHGEPAKEQHLEGCWHNIPSVGSFNGQTQSVPRNCHHGCQGCWQRGHIGCLTQSFSPHPRVLRTNSLSGKVSGTNFLLKPFLALISPNSGKWRWGGVLSREPCCCTPQMRNYISPQPQIIFAPWNYCTSSNYFTLAQIISPPQIIVTMANYCKLIQHLPDDPKILLLHCRQ